MRIVIIGAGNAGRQLAKRLCEEKHDVVLVDQDADALARAEAELDLLTLPGRGSDPAVLERAEVDRAGLLIAVTDDDATNVLACLLARHAGTGAVIARVTDPNYLHTSPQFDLREMGIDLVINQKQECAREIYNMLRMPGAVEAFDLFAGKVMVAGFRITADSPLADRTPAECDRLDLIQRIRVIAVRRGEELIIPRGDTTLAVNDLVYVVGNRADISDFAAWVCPDIRPFEKVIIAGGGDLGMMLAQMVETELECVLLEQDEERARYCSSHLNRTLVLRADALTESALEEAGLHERTVFAALTGDDEGNIMNCLMAQKRGAGFTITQITRTDFIPVVEQLYLVNRVVSPYISTTNAILHYLRSRNVRAASLLHNLPGELLDIIVRPGGRLDGKTVREAGLPRDAIIASVLRDGEVVTATGDLQLKAGDRLLVFCHPNAVRRIQSDFL